VARINLGYWPASSAVENGLRHGGATDFPASDIRRGWLQGRIDNCAYSAENFCSNAERHFHPGHHANSHQRFRQSAADAAHSVNSNS
jgi:hypothetical protein